MAKKSGAQTNYMTESEEKVLFSYMRNLKERQAERDYALLKLCRMTGMRRAEALALDVGDVYGKTEIVMDERIAKKGCVGEVQLNKEMQDILRRFLNLKKYWGESLEDRAPLFCSRLGKRLSLRSFNDLMTRWCERARIPRYTTHALRHTKAQRIMSDSRHLSDADKGRALTFAMQQLRHKSINSTMVYVMPSKDDMRKVAAI